MASASARPAHSSLAVWRAIAQALATVSSTAPARRSAVLAEPLRWPKYTVTAMPRSRWYSMVSTSPSRTVTVSPFWTLASASAAEAPAAWASASALLTTCCSSGIRVASTS